MSKIWKNISNNNFSILHILLKKFSFQGMRGKKNVMYEKESLPMLDVESNIMVKRPMMMSFHGMRGKRNAPNFSGKYIYVWIFQYLKKYKLFYDTQTLA